MLAPVYVIIFMIVHYFEEKLADHKHALVTVKHSNTFRVNFNVTSVACTIITVELEGPLQYYCSKLNMHRHLSITLYSQMLIY